ncbi:MAG: sigma-54 dependent transcriptional regulator [bacterium]|nr:sigma-54 dependent transcriptional regulator [bacterium]
MPKLNTDKKILIVDDEQQMCLFLKQCLEKEGFTADYVLNGEDALSGYSKYDLIVLDLMMPGISGEEVLDGIKQKDRAFPTIIMSAFGDYKKAFELLNKGADDYVQKPFNVEDMIFRITKVLEIYRLKGEIEFYKTQFHNSTANIVYKSSKIETILETVNKISKENIPVLITGESGVGKELIARAIHYNTYNPRREKLFWTVNCSTFAETLLDDELFGHVKGAFTGSVSDKIGIFEIADGGTLFLDEIADASMSAQAKLLRVVETGEFRRIGETKTRYTNVRIITATNKILSKEIMKKTFREDFYQRLKGLEIHIPPLRERTEDIPELINYFLDISNKEFKRNIKIDSEVMEKMQKAFWQGNVRELKHAVQRLVLLSETNKITVKDSCNILSFHISDIKGIEEETFTGNKSFFDLKNECLSNFEKKFFLNLMQKHNGKIVQAAESINISRKSLAKKLKEYNIIASEYKK